MPVATNDARSIRFATLTAVAAVATSATVAALMITTGGVHEPGERAFLHVLVIGVPAGTGLYALRSPATERFGRLLIGAGFLWSLAVMANSHDSVPYTFGRLFAWAIFPLFAYLLLSFPEGRIALQRDRILFGALAATIVVLYLGSAPFIRDYPSFSPWANCGDDCPRNALFVLDREPGIIDSVIGPGRDLLGALLLVGITASVAGRLRSASTLRRMTITPVVAVGVLSTLSLVAFLVARASSVDSETTIAALGWGWALCLPALAAAFCVGLVQRRLFLGHALSGLTRALSGPLSPERIGSALRTAMGDSAVEVLTRRGDGGWNRADGSPLEPSSVPGPKRALRLVTDGEQPIAAILVDHQLDPDDELHEAIVAVTESALREARLQDELKTSLADLDDSRKRIAMARDTERRRIERDLHDGAQQRLIALRMRLALAEDMLAGNDPVAETLHELEDDVDEALEEIRSLAHGIYPPMLADRGIGDALVSAGRRMPLHVHVEAFDVGRQRPEVESAVYFSCLEALQNAVKHGAGASCAHITLQQNDLLRFQVVDDGAGFDPRATPLGAGMNNMRDRVESLGGALSVESAPGRGTVVRGAVPLAGASEHDRAAHGIQAAVHEQRRQADRDRQPEAEEPVHERREHGVGG